MALDSSDTKLAEKLRQEDPDQFQTLVRMHLSFVLDLNTDEDQGNSSQGRKNNPLSSGQQYCNSILHVLSSMWKDASMCMEYLRFGQHDSIVPFICYDCAAEKTKYRPSKWTFTPFAKKPKSSSKGVMEGAPLTLEGICQVYQLVEFLSKEDNIVQEGIFRRTGNIARQNKLKTMLNQGVALDLENGNFSVHDCASVLKNFLAELPEPLLTDAHYPVYCQIAELSGTVTSSPVPKNGELRLLRSIQLLLLLLPVENRLLLRDLMRLLHLTVSYENKNKMSADNLATIFTPHLLCPRKLTPEAFHTNAQTMSIVLAFMIRKGPELFEIPPKLATDIRAYWLEDEKRKLNAESKLNESKRDGTAANTVFSFVDHELTAQAHSSNPTESALAQLYAHVQSMPESSKKRKLIRQFNKGNGQGTPVQLARGQKQHLRSKSLGDSIKKHIFNKSLKRQKNLHGIRLFGGQRSLSQESVSCSAYPLKSACHFIAEVFRGLFIPQAHSIQMGGVSDHWVCFGDSNVMVMSQAVKSPHTPVSKMKLYQSNSEEGSKSSSILDSMPDLRKSLFDTNWSTRRFQHTKRVSKMSLVNRLVFSDSESSSCQDDVCGNLRNAVLRSLAGQIAEKRKTTADSSTVATPNYEDDGSSPSKSPRLTNLDRSLSPPSSPSNQPQGSSHQGTDIGPVSNSSSFKYLSNSYCNFSIDSPSALPGFFSPHLLVGNSANNKLTTPWNTLLTSTPASQSILRVSAVRRGSNDSLRTSLNHSSCLLTPIADGNNSMSPITRSTQKMPKAMQETMMTPRCRKPVVLLSGSNICHLANITNMGRSSIKVKQQHRSSSTSKDSSSKKSETVNRNAGEAIVGDKENALASSFCSCNHVSCVENTENSTGLSVQDSSSQLSGYCCESGDSLTSTFKSYLMSRSVLTASPVDLSFSSRTGDFDTSSESEDKLLSGEQLSDSLMYCLDGNEPLGSSGADNEPKEECDSSMPGELTSGSGETGFSDKHSSTSRSRICKEGVHETSL